MFLLVMKMREWIKRHASWLSVSLLGSLLLASGCFFSGRKGSDSSSALIAPRPPEFLNGPVAVLLTNASGFSGHVTLETRWSSGPPDVASGDLLARGTQLLFAGQNAKSKAARSRGEEMFSWDVAAGRGYVFNEALQGYAPITSSLAVTNIAVQPVSAPPENIAGHRCQPEQVTLVSNDGVKAAFEVWRAPDLNGLPLRITSAGNPGSFTFNLSSVRLEAPAAKIFAPPDGFTMYDSAESMVAELVTRQHNLKRNTPTFTEDDDILKSQGQMKAPR